MVRVAAQTEYAQLQVEVPDVCPRCRYSIQVHTWGRGVWWVDPGGARPSFLELVFRCPREKDCGRLYLAQFDATNSFLGSADAVYWKFSRFAPVEEKREFEANITRLSPKFEAIYNEAFQAETAGLSLLCGAGYRKALEFLVKDYLKSIPENAEKKPEIEASPLSACIKSFVNDPKIKATAIRAAWLGNDETHYIRKWEEKDLSDLKKLIDLSLYWVSSEILTRELEKSMPDPKTKG